MAPNEPGDGKAVMAVTQRQRAEAVKMYQETDMSADEIGRRFGVSRQSVHRWIQAAGVPLRGPMGPRNRPDDEEEITPSGGLLGRMMDVLIESRRELTAHRAFVETQFVNQQAQLEALTAALNQLVGLNQAHVDQVSKYQDWMRERMGALTQPPHNK